MTFELTVLGSSSALPTSTKYPAAHVLNVHERLFLVDCGEGTQMQLRKAKIKFGKLNHIFISHLHGDHVFGLFGLLSTFDLLGRKNTITIHGPTGIEKLINFYTEQFAPERSFEIKVDVIGHRSEKLVYEDKILEITAFPLKHRVPTFGYLFREKTRPLNIKAHSIQEYNLNYKQISDIKEGKDLVLDTGEKIPNHALTQPAVKPRSYAYCSDTAVYEKNIPLLSGTDLMYHESTFLDRDKKLARQTGHSTSIQAAEMAKRAGVKQLLIGHFSNRYQNDNDFLEEAKTVFENTHVARELQKYCVEQERLRE